MLYQIRTILLVASEAINATASVKWPE